MKYCYLIFLLGSPLFAEAVEIRFPEEELAAESVLPVFENNKKVTMNRRVQLKNKLGISGSFSGRMDEPFLHPFAFSGALEFFFNETHGVRLSSLYFWPGLSRIGLNVISEMKERYEVSFDPGKVHHPQYGFFLSYALAPFYGKISLAANLVTNLNFSMYVGLGMLSLDLDYNRYSSDLQWTYASLIEFNQKIFIGQKFYLYGVLNFLIYHAPNPVWCRVFAPEKNVGDDSCDFYTNRSQVISYENTEKNILFRTIVGGGVGVLLF